MDLFLKGFKGSEFLNVFDLFFLSNLERNVQYALNGCSSDR